jgi:hypothetical protein
VPRSLRHLFVVSSRGSKVRGKTRDSRFHEVSWLFSNIILELLTVFDMILLALRVRFVVQLDTSYLLPLPLLAAGC